MSPARGRPKAGSLPLGDSAKREGVHMSPARGRPKAGSLPPGDSAKREGVHMSPARGFSPSVRPRRPGVGWIATRAGRRSGLLCTLAR